MAILNIITDSSISNLEDSGRLYACDKEEAFVQDFLEIRKHALQNFSKIVYNSIVSICSVITVRVCK